MPIVKWTLRIVAICLAVSALFLLRRPPKSGNAAVIAVEEHLLQTVPAGRGVVPAGRGEVPAGRGPQNESQREWRLLSEERVLKAEEATRFRSSDVIPAQTGIVPAEAGVARVLQDQPGVETVGTQTFEAAHTAEGSRRVGSQKQMEVEVQATETLMGVVDARNCVGLNYGQIMQGAVSTRMVWNGHTFVPQKVCVVKEGDSVTSVWSFEQSGSAVLSELRTGSKAHRGPADK